MKTDYAALRSPHAAADKTHRHDDAASSDTEDAPSPPRAPLSQLFAFADATDRALLAVGALAALAAGLSHPLQIVLLGDMLDAFHPSSGSSAAAAAFDADVARVARTFAVVGAAVAACCFLQVACWSLAASRQAARIRRAYVRALLAQPLGWFDAREPMQLATRATDAAALLQDGMGRRLGDALHLASLAVSGVAIGFVKGWELTLVLLAFTPFIAAAASLMVKVTSTATQAGVDSYAQAGAVALESLRHIRTVHALNAGGHFAAKYARALSAATRAGVKKHVAVGAGAGAMLFLVFCTYAGGMFYGALKIANARRDGCVDYSDGCYSGGRVVTVFFSVIMGAMALGQAGPSIEAVVSARVAAVDVFAVINAQSEIDPRDEHRGLKPADVQGRIKLDRVSFAYPSRPDVLVCKDYSLTINAGETVALVGASGSGKSTVVALLERFYDPLSGIVELDGRDVRSLNVKWLRKQIALVGQTPVLFASSIMENIRYGHPDATNEQVVEAAKRANAYEFVMAFPQGFDTQVGERGAQLSGGQKQRIAIARAIVRDPKILLLDEATSALDTENERLVQASLDALQGSSRRTTVIVAHRLSTIRRADRIAVHSNGSIVEIGTHDELIGIPHGLYRQLVEAEVHHARELREDDAGTPTQLDDRTQSQTTETLSTLPHKADVSTAGVVKPDEAAADETFDGELVAMSRVWQRALSDWKFMVLGVVGAGVNAAVFPVWGVLLTKIIVLFFDERPRHDLLTTARYWSLGFIALGVVFGVSILVQHYGFAVASQRLVGRVRQSAYESMLRQDVAWFDRTENSSGALVSRLSSDAAVLQSVTADALNQGLVTFVSLAIAFSIAFTRSWEMTLLIVAIAPVLIFMSTIQARVMSGTMNDKNLLDADASAGALVVEAVGSIRTVASLGLEGGIEDRYGALLEASRTADKKTGIVGGIAFGGSEGAMFFATALLFYCGGKWVRAGRITFEDMLMVIMVIMLSMVGVGQAAQHAVDQTKARRAASRVFQIIDRSPEIDAAANEGEVIRNVTGAIEFKNVAFAYPSRHDAPVYKDYNLKIAAGQTVALVGASGSGKSTAISLLERFYDPTSGSVTLDGIDLRTLSLRWLRDRIALVSQEPVLFSGTIAENIALGKPDATLPEVVEAAEQANAYDFISQFPDGFETRVGDDGVQVSGGQRQRIAIARAVLQDREVLLLDEATSALDNESEGIVQESLEKLVAAKTRTTIIVAHRLSTIRNAHLIAVVKGGKIVEQGTHDQLLALPNSVYRTLVGQQIP